MIFILMLGTSTLLVKTRQSGSFTNLLLSEQLMHLPVEYGIEYSKILITTICYVVAALTAGTIEK